MCQGGEPHRSQDAGGTVSVLRDGGQRAGAAWARVGAWRVVRDGGDDVQRRCHDGRRSRGLVRRYDAQDNVSRDGSGDRDGWLGKGSGFSGGIASLSSYRGVTGLRCGK